MYQLLFLLCFVFLPAEVSAGESAVSQPDDEAWRFSGIFEPSGKSDRPQSKKHILFIKTLRRSPVRTADGIELSAGSLLTEGNKTWAIVPQGRQSLVKILVHKVHEDAENNEVEWRPVAHGNLHIRLDENRTIGVYEKRGKQDYVLYAGDAAMLMHPYKRPTKPAPTPPAPPRTRRSPRSSHASPPQSSVQASTVVTKNDTATPAFSLPPTPAFKPQRADYSPYLKGGGGIGLGLLLMAYGAKNLRDATVAHDRLSLGRPQMPASWLRWQRVERRSEIKALIAAVLGLTSMSYGVQQLWNKE